ncbi:prolyl oligopeptidase family serine peptidase [Sphingobium estronivorans]|uniref:S9 family peptidase n=1 Tax=Sphingobium estronivorans TaxID=1577690 RepID=UPI00123BB03A|nr:prolyl oligopeptidase family serine peptidase [Sphingobium estronivorans]
MRFPWLAALCLAAASIADARPYGVDDMLRVESYGQALIDPDGRWAVIDRYRRYDSAASYRYDGFTRRGLGVVMRLDLQHGSRLEPLFPQDDGAGYWIASLSPSGKRLAVFRLKDETLSLGIVEMATRDVRWLPQHPATSLLHPAPDWLGDRHLAMLAADSLALPWPFAAGSRYQAEVIPLWARTAQGQEPGVSVVGGKGEAAPVPQRRLVMMDVETGRTTQLAEGPIADVAISPDGASLALLREGPETVIPSNVPVRSSDQNRQYRLSILSIRGGSERQACIGCDIQPGFLEWAPKGDRLMFYARKPGEDWVNGELRLFDARTGQSGPALKGVTPFLPPDDSGVRLVRAGWWGEVPLVFGQRGAEPKRWIGPRAAVAIDNALERLPCQPPALQAGSARLLLACPEGLWTIDRTGKSRRIIAGEPVVMPRSASESFDIGIRAQHRSITAISDDAPIFIPQGSEAQLGWPDALMRKVETADFPITRLLAGNRRGGIALWVARDGRGVGRLMASGPAGIREIDRINAHLADIDLPDMRPLTNAATGLADWLILPPGPSGRQLPLVVVPYPGSTFTKDRPPALSPDMVTAPVNPLLLTSLGYAVLMPSLVDQRDGMDRGATLRAQVEQAVDRAIATGLVDGERMGIYGHSFGGYTSLKIATQSHRFRAYIASAAPSDLALQHGTLSPSDRVALEEGFPLTVGFGWAEGGQGSMQTGPQAAPERYRLSSPYYQVGAISDPVLLIHGDIDPVLAINSERMFTQLHRRGRDVTLLRYWGEAHNLRSPGNIRDMWQHIAAWLSDRLAVGGSLMPSAAPTIPSPPALQSANDRRARAALLGPASTPAPRGR